MTAARIPSSDRREYEQFCKHFFYKAVQIIVQSRLGERAWSTTRSSSWFNLSINDIPEVASEAKRVYSPDAIDYVLEISLKTVDGESLVLEAWTLSFTFSETRKESHKFLSNVVYTHLGLLLKSLLCVSRVTPAYKLSRRQGPETFIVCYRLTHGDSGTLTSLGTKFQTADIGTVTASNGSISLKVDYRTEMTILPSAVDPILLLKSDHFESKTPLISGVSAKSSDDSAITSDDSQDAVRLFATSPPNDLIKKTEEYFKCGAFSSKNYEVHFDDKEESILEYFTLENNVSPIPKIPTLPIKETETFISPLTVPTLNPTDKNEFELLDFKLPFSNSTTSNPVGGIQNSEFKIFFKEVPLNLECTRSESRYDVINEQLSGFESELAGFENMIKTLDSMTSESETEGTL